MGIDVNALQEFEVYAEDGEGNLGAVISVNGKIPELKTPMFYYYETPIFEEDVDGFLENLAKSLKPCPLCGGHDLYISDCWPHHIYCMTCHLKMMAGTGLELAVYRWNHEGREPDDREV